MRFYVYLTKKSLIITTQPPIDMCCYVNTVNQRVLSIKLKMVNYIFL